MRDVGIIGLPLSGKSTLFTALTHTGAIGGRANQAVVDVPDDRTAVVAGIHGSNRVVPAKVRFRDVPGGLSPHALAEHRQSDALCVVVRAFGEDAEPERDLERVQAELALADLRSVENGLEKVAKKARTSDDARGELAVLEAARDLLVGERLLRDGDFDDRALKTLRGYGALTLKPWIVVANVEEDGSSVQLPRGAIPISAALEAEAAEMDDAVAMELLEGFGIEEPGLKRVIVECYRALDLVTFFTADDKEARAWEVPRGARAPQAAGAIHSDMERGFIRAEVVAYERLVDAGSIEAARRRGWLRIEGKDYVVQEGDVVRVRFAL